MTFKAARVSGYWRKIYWRNKNMAVTSKAKIYSSVVHAVIIYACEIRAETQKKNKSAKEQLLIIHCEIEYLI